MTSCRTICLTVQQDLYILGGTQSLEGTGKFRTADGTTVDDEGMCPDPIQEGPQQPYPLDVRQIRHMPVGRSGGRLIEHSGRCPPPTSSATTSPTPSGSGCVAVSATGRSSFPTLYYLPSGVTPLPVPHVPCSSLSFFCSPSDHISPPPCQSPSTDVFVFPSFCPKMNIIYL